MRITPSKWDAEYGWLRDEACKRFIGTSPMVNVERTKGNRWGRSSGDAEPSFPGPMDRPSITVLGLGLQAAGAMAIMVVSNLGSALVTALCLTALLGGEIIFINSLGYRGIRARGDRTR